jgi:formate C-acetyltransferase
MCEPAATERDLYAGSAGRPQEGLPCSASALEELQEFAALGFYEGLGLPWPRAYGLASRRMHERMPIRIVTGRWLQPDACNYPPAGVADNRGAPHPCIVRSNYAFALMVDRTMADQRRRERPDLAPAIDALVADLAPRLAPAGGPHHIPDLVRVVNEGFLTMTAGLAAVAEPTPQQQALLDYRAGILAFHARSLAAIREAALAATGDEQRRLTRVAGAFSWAFLHPARDFLEGLLACQFTWGLDGCDGIGRLDRILGHLYERDLASGVLDQATASALIDELYVQFQERTGWNLQIGGRCADNSLCDNALTREAIAACARRRQSQPNVALRLATDTPAATLDLALQALATGSGRPAIYNDDRYLDILMAPPFSVPFTDAVEYGFGGCTETMLGGMSNVGSTDGIINLARALELALFGGQDPGTGLQAGPATPDLAACARWEDFLAALDVQIDHQAAGCLASIRPHLKARRTMGVPQLCRTLLTRGCLESGRLFEDGGARYNWSVITYLGSSNLIDGLAALQLRVFEEGIITRERVLQALRANFEGFQAEHRLLCTAPHFGNDDDRADLLGVPILRRAWSRLLATETPRGGRFVPSIIGFIFFGMEGKRVGALPDGRLAGQPLADSAGAVAGRDRRGPTALLASVAKLPLDLAMGTPVVNLRFQRAMLAEASGRQAVAALVRGFFARGGLQVQISCLSAEEMRAAQADPERHRDLIVRLGGFSASFIHLSPEMQQTVIARTEHGAN